jgi:hypothetical protein
LLKPEDEGGLTQLEAIYPEGHLSLYDTKLPTKSFLIYYVP